MDTRSLVLRFRAFAKQQLPGPKHREWLLRKRQFVSGCLASRDPKSQTLNPKP